MKIAFWSGQEKVGTTFNTAAVACAAVMMYPISIGMISSDYCDRDLEKNFQGKAQAGRRSWRRWDGGRPWTAGGTLPSGQAITALPAEGRSGGMLPSGQAITGLSAGRSITGFPAEEGAGGILLAAEEEEYFLDGGLDCLLCREEEGELDGQLLQANMQQVIEGRLSVMPSSHRQEYKWWYKDRLFAQMRRIVAVMEESFDLVLIDCGARRDDFTREILQESGLCVLNMDQASEQIGDFYRTPPSFRSKTFFLVGNYFQEELYNRENLERLYRMEADMLGAIPYNPQMQAASKAGMMDVGIRKYINHGMRGKDIGFERETIRSARLILKRAGVIE